MPALARLRSVASRNFTWDIRGYAVTIPEALQGGGTNFFECWTQAGSELVRIPGTNNFCHRRQLTAGGGSNEPIEVDVVQIDPAYRTLSSLATRLGVTLNRGDRIVWAPFPEPSAVGRTADVSHAVTWIIIGFRLPDDFPTSVQWSGTGLGGAGIEITHTAPSSPSPVVTVYKTGDAANQACYAANRNNARRWRFMYPLVGHPVAALSAFDSLSIHGFWEARA